MPHLRQTTKLGVQTHAFEGPYDDFRPHLRELTSLGVKKYAFEGPTIVLVHICLFLVIRIGPHGQTRELVKHIHAVLESLGVQAGVYHAGMLFSSTGLDPEVQRDVRRKFTKTRYNASLLLWRLGWALTSRTSER